MSHLIREVGRYGVFIIVTCYCGWGTTIHWEGDYFEAVEYIKGAFFTAPECALAE